MFASILVTDIHVCVCVCACVLALHIIYDDVELL